MDITKSKTCFKCKVEKPITEFYVHPQMGDGRLNKCKECTKRDVRKNYRDNIEYFRKYDRGRANLPHRVEARKEYSRSEAGKLSNRRAHKKQKEMFPEKVVARNAVSNAVRDGRLDKPDTCEKCGAAGKIEAHHTDYSKPLKVEWLCFTCHRAEHSQEAVWSPPAKAANN